MITNCEICNCEVNVKSKKCCNGRDCGCEGKETFEGVALCFSCKEVAEYLDKHDKYVGYRENGMNRIIYGDDIAEVE